MALDNLNVVDIVSINKNNEVVLTVVDDLGWESINEHLIKLQDKLNAYIDSVENGSLYESYPDAKNKKVIIYVALKNPISPKVEIFFQKTAYDLEFLGYGFTYSIVDSSPIGPSFS